MQRACWEKGKRHLKKNNKIQITSQSFLRGKKQTTTTNTPVPVGLIFIDNDLLRS